MAKIVQYFSNSIHDYHAVFIYHKMTKTDKARIYIKQYTNVKNSDIEISGMFIVNGKKYKAVTSPTYSFLPFLYTEKVNDFFITQRKEKLLNLMKNEIVKKYQ